MTIETLVKLSEPKRIAAAVLTVLATAAICHYAITRASVVRLWAAKAKYVDIRTAYAGTENQHTDFLNLQKQLEGREKQLQEYQQRCFSSTQALQFFENINSMALSHNLRPISRLISEPKELVTNRESKPQQRFLKTQSARIAVCGNYFDIVDFVNEFMDRPQKVCMTNLHIALPAGEKYNPKASFKITLVIDSSKDVKE